MLIPQTRRITKVANWIRSHERILVSLGAIVHVSAFISIILVLVSPAHANKLNLVSASLVLFSPILLKSKDIADFIVPPRKPISEMTPEELFDLIRNSDPSKDWEGPKRGVAESIVSYKDDHRLRFSNKDGEEGTQNPRFEAPWANCFLDRNACGLYYDLYSYGEIIKRFILVFVDGGRCLLPLPENEGTLKVDRLNYHVALILNAKKWDTNWQSNFNVKMSQAKLTLKE